MAAATGVRSTRGRYDGTCGENQCGEMRPGCGGPFIGGGTTSRGAGRINGSGWWWRITSMVLELKQEKRRRGDVALMGERKGVTWWFGSASPKRERVAIGGV
jgi:hypothetical protein